MTNGVCLDGSPQMIYFKQNKLEKLLIYFEDE